jgi:probable DNA metabolism protein
MPTYCFDGSMTGLLSCVFRAFQFKEFQVNVSSDEHAQNGLFDNFIQVTSNDQQSQRVWQGLKQKTSSQSQHNFYYIFLSENQTAYQHLFNYCLYIFQHTYKVDENYGHPDVLALAQWAKQVGREKHRMEAFVRFKKCQDGFFFKSNSARF